MQRRRDGGRHDALRGEAQRRRAAAEALRRAKKDAPKDPPFVFLLLALFVLGAAARACYGARRALRAQMDAERGAPAEPCEAVLGDGVRGYIWVASAPPREGANGWRPIVEAAAALARDLGYGLAVPCVRDSEVACCVGAGADAEKWLCSGEDDCPPPEDAEIAGSLYRERSAAEDLGAYFDLGALAAAVGAPAVPPECLAHAREPRFLDVSDVRNPNRFKIPSTCVFRNELFRGFLSRRRDFGEQGRMVQESWETSSI